ncbi:MAG: PilN domain-containing protein [Gaiellaceae bacterium]
MRAINLLPRDDARRARRGPPPVVLLAGVLGGVLVLAVLAGVFMLESGKVAGKRQELQQKQTELNAIPTPPPAATQTQDALAKDKLARIRALNLALSRRVAWDRVLREIAVVLPNDVWLNKLSAKAPVSPASVPSTASPASGPIPVANQVAIQGYTYSQAAVARFLARLSVLPDLANVQLQQSGLPTGQRPGPTVYAFIINANVSTPSGSGS